MHHMRLSRRLSKFYALWVRFQMYPKNAFVFISISITFSSGSFLYLEMETSNFWNKWQNFIVKRNDRILTKHHLFHYITAVLFSVTLISGMLAGLPLQENQQVAYAQGTQGTPSTNKAPTSFAPLCNPKSPSLKLGSTGAKVAELQFFLARLGYEPVGQNGIDGKFTAPTQNAVKKFQQVTRLQPVDGTVGPKTWGTLCVALSRMQQQQAQPATAPLKMGGTPAPIKPQYAYLTKGDPYARVLNLPGVQGQYCNPNSENCNPFIVKPAGGCITIIAAGFHTEAGDMTCNWETRPVPKEWRKYPVLGNYLAEARQLEQTNPVDCEAFGTIAGVTADVVRCGAGDASSCVGAVTGPLGIPDTEVGDFAIEKGSEAACHIATDKLLDWEDTYRERFEKDMAQWCNEYGATYPCEGLTVSYNFCAEKAIRMGVSLTWPEIGIKYHFPPYQGTKGSCSLNY